MMTITLQAPEAHAVPEAKRFERALAGCQGKSYIPGGTRTPNLLIRSQTPCPIGPQGLGILAACSVSY